MINDKILSKFKSLTEWTLFLNERINDGNEISRGKTNFDKSKTQKKVEIEKKQAQVRKRLRAVSRNRPQQREDLEIEEAKDKKEKPKAHDRNTKTKETNVKKHANGAETHNTVEKEPMPDQDMEQEPEAQPPAPPPVAPVPGSQVKIGRKELKPEVEPAARKVDVSKESNQKIDLKPSITIKPDNDYSVQK